MKNIKIQIYELGAVHNSQLELKPLMIFSGESGLGKSYVAILVHYFYKLLAENRLQGFFDAEGFDLDTLSQKSPEEGSFIVSSEKLTSWIVDDSKDYMRQSVGNEDLLIDVSFVIPFNKKEYSFRYKKVLFGLEGKEEISYLFQMDSSSMRIEFGSDVKSIGSLPWAMLFQETLCAELIGDDSIDQTFAMVPGRGALLNIPFNLQDRIKNVGDIYSEFLSDWYVVRSMRARKNIDSDLVSLLFDINGGKVELDDNNRVFYRINDGALLPISAAASSIKELAPLYMLLDKYPARQLSILFEEPEAHLHPQKQVDIADFVIRAVNKGTHMQITTHSDYFLRRLNDRIFLHKIFEADEKIYQETLEKFGYSDLTFNPSMIGAYLLRREVDGSVKVISQDLEKGIPYESFYNVIRKESRYSLDIQQVYYNLKTDHA